MAQEKQDCLLLGKYYGQSCWLEGGPWTPQQTIYWVDLQPSAPQAYNLRQGEMQERVTKLRRDQRHRRAS